MTQLNQNTTDLQSILDAVNALPEASKVKLGVTLNSDGTQSLIIRDDGGAIPIPEDMTPVLLWTNASPESKFSSQTITVEYSQYQALLIESRNYYGTGTRVYSIGLFYPDQSSPQFILSQNTDSGQGYVGINSRKVTFANGNAITFDRTYIYQTGGYAEASDNSIPTRIWGAKFTL